MLVSGASARPTWNAGAPPPLRKRTATPPFTQSWSGSPAPPPSSSGAPAGAPAGAGAATGPGAASGPGAPSGGPAGA